MQMIVHRHNTLIAFSFEEIVQIGH